MAANTLIATYVLPKLLYKFQMKYQNIKVNIIIFAIICSLVFILIEKIKVKNNKLHFNKNLWLFFHLI
ncbi:hypothetical protein fh0823_08090 [Francisella halioticida]|uniref:Uncharacterized protein n=1 Tax=Francisella halioticida TaxID=549298 RepID=A0ABM6LZI9_9GAMM|nr:hypothetical protein [Francisella halioticida]ASG67851.1 hypothetical protein CDV26_05125 [Francisella halioticida]BCD90670.1 hypothetical protein fh0823_08090 [Francisella halioticida]